MPWPLSTNAFVNELDQIGRPIRSCEENLSLIFNDAFAANHDLVCARRG